MNMKSTTCVGSRTGKPLTEYQSENQARLGASHVRAEFGTDMSPYRCARCGLWHLSPKQRHTPSSKCGTCTDRNGDSKDLYASKKAAEVRAKIIKKENNIALAVYRCPNDTGWHLTKA